MPPLAKPDLKWRIFLIYVMDDNESKRMFSLMGVYCPWLLLVLKPGCDSNSICFQWPQPRIPGLSHRLHSWPAQLVCRIWGRLMQLTSIGRASREEAHTQPASHTLLVSIQCYQPTSASLCSYSFSTIFSTRKYTAFPDPWVVFFSICDYANNKKKMYRN